MTRTTKPIISAQALDAMALSVRHVAEGARIGRELGKSPNPAVRAPRLLVDPGGWALDWAREHPELLTKRESRRARRNRLRKTRSHHA